MGPGKEARKQEGEVVKKNEQKGKQGR